MTRQPDNSTQTIKQFSLPNSPFVQWFLKRVSLGHISDESSPYPTLTQTTVNQKLPVYISADLYVEGQIRNQTLEHRIASLQTEIQQLQITVQELQNTVANMQQQPP